MNPVTLHIQRTDDTTVKAVQLFAKRVVLTCNENEYWAALERLEPPTKVDGSEIRDCPIIYPQVGSVIGWFAGCRAAVVRTGQGNKCRDELTTALTKSFPNGKAVIVADPRAAFRRQASAASKAVRVRVVRLNSTPIR